MHAGSILYFLLKCTGGWKTSGARNERALLLALLIVGLNYPADTTTARVAALRLHSGAKSSGATALTVLDKRCPCGYLAGQFNEGCWRHCALQ